MGPKLLKIYEVLTNPDRIGWFSEYVLKQDEDNMLSTHLMVRKVEVKTKIAENIKDIDSYLFTLIINELKALKNVFEIKCDQNIADTFNDILRISNRMRIDSRHSAGKVVYISKEIYDKLIKLPFAIDNRAENKNNFKGLHVNKFLDFIVCEYLNIDEMIMFSGSERSFNQPFHFMYEKDGSTSNRLVWAFNLDKNAYLIKLDPRRIVEMNNEAQEKELPIGVDTFEEVAHKDSDIHDDGLAWFECGIVPDEINANNVKYTQYHINQILKWLTEKVLDGQGYVPLNESLTNFEHYMDLTKIVGVISAFKFVSPSKVHIGIKPLETKLDLFYNYKDELKLTSLFVASLEKAEDHNVVSEKDSELLYFFLHGK
jgi:hypothetical protein